jgi:aconitate hydratase A / 2-methylisocitrate dehydratase
MPKHNTFKTQQQLSVNNTNVTYYSLPALKDAGLNNVEHLPFTLKVLLENLLRHEDGDTVKADDVKAVVAWLDKKHSDHEIAYRPARVLMQDFTGVPAIVDLAAMRTAMDKMGGDADKINPLSPVDLVIDHSVQVDKFATPTAYQQNTEIEMQRNRERYEFLRWGQNAFKNFRVVPPGTGICHQVNLEYLAKGVWHDQHDGGIMAYPDTLVGTDSHTTMINGLGVLGWGVGGIEAEAAMLGQPISMLLPEVIGFRLTGQLPEGITATDLVLTVTQMLRAKGVVGKFVEFFGPGLDQLPLADRATIANMAPEYGATCGFFPIDNVTIDYMRLTGRDEDTIALVEAYCKAQGLWREADSPEPQFTDTLELDLSTVVASLAGPKRPQDKVTLPELGARFDELLEDGSRLDEARQSFDVDGKDFKLHHGDVVIAAITSCTNTSNPSVLMAAGLLAKNALDKGLQVKPWVKTSLAPGSKVVTEYLEKAGLQTYLDKLGFSLVGYGCTTCIGNSGPLDSEISQSINDNNLVMSSVLSGNRNFEGRVHPDVKANWLASPPLVVAYALAGTTRIDLSRQPVGKNEQGDAIYLKDIWPSNADVAEAVTQVNQDMFKREYKDVFTGDQAWQQMPTSQDKTYTWADSSTYIQYPPFFEGLDAQKNIEDIKGARVLALLGDSITTDHISPAGAIKADSPAGLYLQDKGIPPNEFNSYGSRRGNHQVMLRGTFANIRIRNEMVPGVEGGYTKLQDSDEPVSIFDAAMHYQQDNIPLVVIAGKEYGTGSSRDWAAKGTRLLGIKAVIAESFERIHRSNLIGMGILPLQFTGGDNRKTLELDGSETVTIENIAKTLAPACELTATITRASGEQQSIQLLCRIDTQNELAYFNHGGILQYVLGRLNSST